MLVASVFRFGRLRPGSIGKRRQLPTEHAACSSTCCRVSVMNVPSSDVRSPQAFFEHVDSRMLTAFPELVGGLGGSSDDLLARVGIAPRMPGTGNWSVSYRQIIALMALAANELECPDFGMRLAERQAGEIQSPLQQVVSNSRTLGDALENVASYSFAH